MGAVWFFLAIRSEGGADIRAGEGAGRGGCEGHLARRRLAPGSSPSAKCPSTTFSAAVRRAEKPRITKGFRPKLWTARRAEWGETFSVWPFVSEALYCARSVRVWESVAGQKFASGVAGGEFARAFAWSRGADLQIEGTGRS